MLKKFNLAPTESCLPFPGCRQIKTFAKHTTIERQETVAQSVYKQSKDLKTELIKGLEQSMSHSLKYFQRVLKN